MYLLDMKYNLKITFALVLIFIISQIIGLSLANASIRELRVLETGEKVVTYKDLPVERPETKGFDSLAYILMGIAVATGIFLLIVKFQLFRLWKLWFFVAIWLTMSISFSIVMEQTVALSIAFVIALTKVLKPHPVVHNAAEMLVYSGIVLLLFPVFEVKWVIALLLVISAYDFIAVFKSGHMVSMAKFTMKAKLFPGISLPLKAEEQEERIAGKRAEKPGKKEEEAEEKEYQAAILGGGDITFPMLFSSVVMQDLFRNGLDKVASLSFSLIITLTTAMSLFLLLYMARKGRFYPAMPFVTAGCFVGYGIVLLFAGTGLPFGFS